MKKENKNDNGTERNGTEPNGTYSKSFHFKSAYDISNRCTDNGITDQIQNKTRKTVDAFEMFYSKCVMFLSLLLSGLPRDWRFQVFIT